MRKQGLADIPVLSRVLAQGGLLLLLSAYCFTMYALIRPLFGTIGFDATTVFKTTLAVIVLGIFVLGLAPMTNIPSIIHQHVAPSRRFRRGECPGCGYPEADRIESRECPECGAAFREPPEWRMRSGMVTSFLLLFLIAVVLGGTIAETRLLVDEQRWMHDCSLPGGARLESRARIWPSGYSLLFNDPVEGPYAEPLDASRRAPEARPVRSSRTESVVGGPLSSAGPR